MENDQFKGILLTSKGSILNKEAFLQALIDNLSTRMTKNIFFLNESTVLDVDKWPSGIEAPWVDGELKLKSLCSRFSLSFKELQQPFRYFIDDPANPSPAIIATKAVIATLPVRSAECERGFPVMNNICSDLRNQLTINHVSNLMLISLVGPPVCSFDLRPYVELLLRKHRNLFFVKVCNL